MGKERRYVYVSASGLRVVSCIASWNLRWGGCITVLEEHIAYFSSTSTALPAFSASRLLPSFVETEAGLNLLLRCKMGTQTCDSCIALFREQL